MQRYKNRFVSLQVFENINLSVGKENEPKG
jgi:hypothetical protein